jgi:hypothetical protein
MCARFSVEGLVMLDWIGPQLPWGSPAAVAERCLNS